MKNSKLYFFSSIFLLSFLFANEDHSHKITTKKDYSGITLNILTHEVPVMGEPTIIHAKEFEKLTGIKINIKHIEFPRLYQEAIKGLKTNKYDIIFYGSAWIADFYKYLEPIPNQILQSKEFKDIIPHYQDIAKWGDTTYQFTIDGDRHYFQYRKDLIEDKKLQAKYKEEYAKELKVPQTWKELNKIAKFFHGREVKEGEYIRGFVEITKKEDLLFSQFIKRAASYAKHPDVKDGFYFDLKTMKPLINTPGFVEALEDFVQTQYYYPPDGLNIGIADQIKSFGNGKSFATDSWDDSFVQAMEKNSGIHDKVASSISLGSKKVWNRKTSKWDYFKNVNHVPYFAWGWTSAVTKSSKHKNAAFDFLTFFTNNKNHFNDLTIGRYGINPYRFSDVNENFWIEKANWNKISAKSYVKTLKDMKKSNSYVIDLRIYESRQYMNALAIGVHRALTKRDTPQKALDEVARKWNNITRLVGIEKQREAYSYVVKLENPY